MVKEAFKDLVFVFDRVRISQIHASNYSLNALNHALCNMIDTDSWIDIF